MTKQIENVATLLDDSTRIACNPAGTGRVVPGKCVAVALAAIGTGTTVAAYKATMAKWQAKSPAPHMCYPGGSSAERLLRYLVDGNRKVIVVAAKVRKARASKPASELASEPANA
jgi:hypothetical protein